MSQWRRGLVDAWPACVRVLTSQITNRQLAPPDPGTLSTSDAFNGHTAAMDPAHLLLNVSCLPNHSAAEHYPAPTLARNLWNHYLEYVNPICKIIHVPTLQKVFDASLVDPRAIPKYDLALLLSMHLFAVA